MVSFSPFFKLECLIQVLFPYLFLVMVTPKHATSGAWVQKKDGLYAKVSSSYVLATKEFNHEGRRLDIFQERVIYKDTSFRDLNANAYLEFGLFESFTLITNLSYKRLTSKRSELLGGGSATRIVTISTAGLSDIALSGRYLLFDHLFVLSFQGGAKIPLGYEQAPSDDGPPLGTGNLDLDAQLLFGKSLFPLPAYVTTSLGYRWRSGALHDQILFTAEGGYSFGPVLVKVNLDVLKSTISPPDIVGQPVTTPLPGGGGAIPNIIQGDQDIFRFSPSVIVDLTNRIALQGEILHTIAGKNTVAGTIYSFGVIYTR